MFHWKAFHLNRNLTDSIRRTPTLWITITWLFLAWLEQKTFLHTSHSNCFEFEGIVTWRVLCNGLVVLEGLQDLILVFFGSNPLINFKLTICELKVSCLNAELLHSSDLTHWTPDLKMIPAPHASGLHVWKWKLVFSQRKLVWLPRATKCYQAFQQQVKGA